jgi:RNA polymerase sigma-32 factor
MSDVISEANIGLMQAVKKFDMNKKVRLATYAIWWIKAAINDYVLRSWSLVKIGTVAAQKKLFYNLSRIKARLGLYENKELEPKVVKQIANELMVEERDVTEMNRRIGGDSSLNVSLGDDEEGREKIDMIVDARENIEAKLAYREEQKYKAQILARSLQTLDDREQYIIKNRMLTDSPSTLEDIGEYFNISRERVRQIEKKAFEKLSAEVKRNMAA